MRNQSNRRKSTDQAMIPFVFCCSIRKAVARFGFSLLAAIIVLATVSAPPAGASILRKLPFSATLKSAASGVAVTDGNYSITFSIYQAETAGAAVWSETQTVAVKDGIVSVNLGDGTALPTSLTFDNSPYYLGVKIGSDTEMSPRRLIGTVPAALNADTVDGAHAGTTASTVLLLDSSGHINIAGNIITAGTLQGATATVSTLSTGSGNLTVSPAGGTTVFSGTPTASATASLLQLGSALTGGSSSGTYLGINATTGFAGNFADWQINGTTKFKVSSNGLVTGGSILPSTSALYDLGSSSLHFANAYIDNIVAGTTSTSGTTATSFTIDQNATGDADASLLFYRGGTLTSAKFGWTAGTGANGVATSSGVFTWNNPGWVITTVPADADYGQLSIGSAATAFDGVTAGFFAGSASGTVLALNAASGYAGNLADWQVAGSSKFKVSAAGNVGIGTTSPGALLDVGTGSGILLRVNGTANTLHVTAGGVGVGEAPLTAFGVRPAANQVFRVRSVASNTQIYSANDGNSAYTPLQVDGSTLLLNYQSGGNVGIGTTSPASRFHIPVAPTASANVGLVSLGSGPWDGVTAGFFAGSASGTVLALNAASGYAGTLADWQVAGSSKFQVNASGAVTTNQINLTGGTGTKLVAAYTGVFEPQMVFTSTNTQSPRLMFQAGNQVVLDIVSERGGSQTFTAAGPAATNGYASFIFQHDGSLVRGPTSGTNQLFLIPSNFAPTSGTAVFNTLELQSTVNQTGTATGVSRGLYITPTLTAAVDWRALEVASGRVLFGGPLSASANYGQLSLGAGPFNGTTAGFFAGSASGTVLALNAASGYAGTLADWQVAGSSKFKVDASGNLTVAGTQTFTGNTTISGNLSVNGNTTLGDAAADTVTINANALTLANASTLALATSTTALNISAGLLNLDTTNSRVGIGTTGPVGKLSIGAGPFAFNPDFAVVTDANGWGYLSRSTGASAPAIGNTAASFGVLTTRGTQAARTALQNGDALGEIFFGGFDGTSLLDIGARVAAVADGTVSAGVMPGALVFQTTNASGTPVERMRITAAGSVGIGTATPAALLNLAGNKSAAAWTTTGLQLAVDAATLTDTSTAAAGTVATRAANSLGTPTLASTNAITVTDAATLYIAAAPAAGTNTTLTRGHALQVAAGDSVFAGNVGIGTTAPAEKLTVAGGNVSLTTANSYIAGTTGLTLSENGDTYGTVALRLQNRAGVNGAMFEQLGTVDLVDFVFKSLSNQRNIRFEDRAALIFAGDPEFQIGIAGDPTFVSGDSVSAFRKGNVGIGTATPAALLNLAGNKSAAAWTTTGLQLAVDAATLTDTSTAAAGTVATRAANSLGTPTLASTNAITVTDAATLYIAAAPAAGTNTTLTRGHALQVAAGDAVFAGNVGIGTTAPIKVLHAKSATDSTVYIESSGASGNNAGVQVKGGVAGADWFLGTNRGDLFGAQTSFGLYENNATTTRLVVQAGGNVGIGTATPAALLNLAGNKSAAAWTTTGLQLAVDAATLTDTSTVAAGTVATRAANSLGTPTLASTNAITVTDAATLYIAAAPAAGTNTTLTRGHALQVAAGDAVFAGNVGIGTTAPAAGGGLTIGPAARTSGSPALLTVTGPADTTLAADTEASDVYLNLARTVQFTAGAGAFTTQRAVRIAAPTYAASAAETITTAATLYVADAPAAGLNMTITTPYALWVDNGAVQFDGNLAVGGTLTVTGTQTFTGNQTISGNLSANGNTTLGDAAADTVTANAAAWTFANDTAVTLSGGVNGINFGSNTLSIDATNNRVGIGTAAPSQKLHAYSASGANYIFTETAAIDNSAAGLFLRGGQLNASWTINTNTDAAVGVAPDSLFFFKEAGTTGVKLVITNNGNVGIGAAAPTNALSFGGNSARILWLERHTTANTAGNSLTVQAGGATSAATDKDGGQLILAPGASTGTGRSIIAVQGYTQAAATGTADNTKIDVANFGNSKALANNTATALANFTVANGSVAAGIIKYAVQATDGTDYQVEEGQVSFHVTNKAGTIANNVTTKYGNQQSMTVGTLTVTFTITAANPAVLTVNANSSLVTSAGYPLIRYSIENLTSQAMAANQ